MAPAPDPVTGALLYPEAAAKLLGVHPKTLVRWEKHGLLASVRTLGGHRRYRLEDVQHILGGRGDDT